MLYTELKRETNKQPQAELLPPNFDDCEAFTSKASGAQVSYQPVNVRGLLFGVFQRLADYRASWINRATVRYAHVE